MLAMCRLSQHHDIQYQQETPRCLNGPSGCADVGPFHPYCLTFMIDAHFLHTDSKISILRVELGLIRYRGHEQATGARKNHSSSHRENIDMKSDAFGSVRDLEGKNGWKTLLVMSFSLCPTATVSVQ